MMGVKPRCHVEARRDRSCAANARNSHKDLISGFSLWILVRAWEAFGSIYFSLNKLWRVQFTVQTVDSPEYLRTRTISAAQGAQQKICKLKIRNQPPAVCGKQETDD